MSGLGRFLQYAGLATPPLGVLGELTGTLSLGQMLLVLVFGVCLFAIGRLVEAYRID